MLKKLNLGCGKDIRKECINVDYAKGDGVDIVHDLNKTPYPFKNDEFDIIYAKAILEHIPDIHKVLNELLRILKKDGKLIITVPHFSGSVAFGAGHVNFFRYRDFEYRGVGNDKDYLARFKTIKKKIIFDKNFPFYYNYVIEPIVNLWKLPLVYENTFLKAFFPAHAMYIELRKIE